MSFPRYPAYKDSGVEWIGEIPGGWVTTPIRSLAVSAPKSFTDGDWIESPFITDAGVRLLQTGNIGVGNYKEQGFRYISEETFENLHCTEVRPGDLLICRLAEPVGRACIAPALKEKMITSVDVAILKTSLFVSVNYFNYVLSAPSYLSFMESECRGGTRNRVSRSFLGSVRVPFPPLPEQQAIASFLDRECGKIDALIAEQERLIALLAEKRQAVISHAVTKGLNPNALMKDSGIPWVGMVPEGWEVRPIKMIAEIFGRIGYRGYTSADIVDETIGVISLSPSNMNNGKVYFDEKNTYITKEKYEESPEIKISPNDILLVKTGSTIGKVAYVYEQDFIESTINPQIVVFKKIKIDKKFLFFVMSTNFMRSVFEIGNVGGTIPTMSQSYISNLRIVIPTMSEQKMISNSLSEQERKFRSEREYALKIISLLKERRAALISAAVTGKIDVRAQSEALAA